jgi:NodT family efflux transporter outer membrane factor (OMF) lipoprotein
MNKKIILAVAISFIVSGCAVNESGFENYPYGNTNNSFYNIGNQYKINTEWWKGYNDDVLNDMVKLSIERNIDFKIGVIKVNKVLYTANISGAELIPTLSANINGSASKNIKEGGNSNINVNSTATLQYTLDLWGKLKNAAEANELEYKATQKDLDVIKLNIENSIISNYFKLKMLKENENIYNDNLKNYEKIYSISSSKYKYGLISSLDVVQAKQSVESTKNTINSNKLQIKQTEQTLKNLLNYKPEDKIKTTSQSLLSVSNINVDLNVPISAISKRPDIQASEYRLMSSFKNKVAAEKTIYPDITLSTSLSSSGNKLNNNLNAPIGALNVGINLPFLDWNKIKWNIKGSQADFEQSRLNFEQSLTTALNDVDVYYYTYNNYLYNFENVNEQYKNNKKITRYYEARYQQGISEMSDWLNAIQQENNAKISIIQAKYNLISSESNIFNAMAGKIEKV